MGVPVNDVVSVTLSDVVNVGAISDDVPSFSELEIVVLKGAAVNDVVSVMDNGFNPRDVIVDEVVSATLLDLVLECAAVDNVVSEFVLGVPPVFETVNAAVLDIVLEDTFF